MSVKREELGKVAIPIALVSSLIGLLRAFGVDITADQEEAILRFLVAAGPLLVWAVARFLVTPKSDPRDDEGHPFIPDDQHAVPGEALGDY